MIEALVFVAHLTVVLILLLAVARLDPGDDAASDLGLFSYRNHAGEGAPEPTGLRSPPRA